MQYDIAAKLRVDQATVARWEKGDTSIPDHQKLKLAKVFQEALGVDISVEHLMGWDR